MKNKKVDKYGSVYTSRNQELSYETNIAYIEVMQVLYEKVKGR